MGSGCTASPSGTAREDPRRRSRRTCETTRRASFMRNSFCDESRPFQKDEQAGESMGWCARLSGRRLHEPCDHNKTGNLVKVTALRASAAVPKCGGSRPVCYDYEVFPPVPRKNEWPRCLLT